MLSLTQKAGETIVLVDDCGREVRFVTQRVHGNRVTYGIEATTQYKIRREKPQRHDSPAELRQRVEELQRQVNRLQRQKVGSN